LLDEKRSQVHSATAMSRAGGRPGTILFTLSLAVYLALLVYQHESVPGPPCNDIAEEALSGYLMIRDGDYRPIYTALNPNGHEALHVLAIGALAHAFGGEPLAILLPAWGATLLLLFLLFQLARTNPQLLDEAVVVPAALSCPWLFHYARTGLRTVASPALLLLFLFLLQAAFRHRKVHGTDVLAGAVLALGTYAYTSSRVVVLAFALFGALELARAWRGSRDEGVLMARKLAGAAAGFLLVFSWNAAWAIRDPATFFGRGTYVVRGGAAEWVANTVATALLPVHYGEGYRSGLGEGHDFDVVAVALPAAGIPAIPLVLGAAFFAGLLLSAWSHRDLPLVRFLLLFYVVSVLVLGFTGPSLTRLYVLFPVFVLLAGVALSRLTAAFPRHRPWMAVALYALAALSLWSYLRAGRSIDAAQLNGAHMAGAVGRRARALCASGSAPLCVVSRDQNVVRYLTIGHWDDLRIREFHRRPFRLRKVEDDLPQADVILVDVGANVEPFVRLLENDHRYRPAARTSHLHEFQRVP
jgi:hypothetical protein